MKTITTIDLGSNSFRVLLYDYINHIIINEYQKMVRTADGLVDTGIINDDAINRVIVAINESITELQYEPSHAIAVTTAAMREAKNSAEVLKCIRDNTGVNFTIIDGIEEARLTLLAVKYALKREKILTDKFVLLDIGGASTEIIVNDTSHYVSNSFDFGIVTMCQKHNDLKLVKKELELKKQEIQEFLVRVHATNLDAHCFVATAGTPTTIAAIKKGQDFFTYDKNVINGTVLKLEDLQNSLETFANASAQTIEKLVGKNRVEFIKVGILIYKAIFEVLNKKESIVLDDGLREGVAVNYSLTLEV